MARVVHGTPGHTGPYGYRKLKVDFTAFIGERISLNQPGSYETVVVEGWGEEMLICASSSTIDTVDGSWHIGSF